MSTAVDTASLARRDDRMKVLEVKGTTWGFYTREDPRMHLQVLDEDAEGSWKVWLETNGERSFVPAGEIPGRILNPLRDAVREHADRVERRWSALMCRKDWLICGLAGEHAVKLAAYPTLMTQFTRVVDVFKVLPGLRRELNDPLKLSDIALDAATASLVIMAARGDEADHVFLPDMLWRGTR